MSILSLMIGNKALGYCFTVENNSSHKIKEAWADVDQWKCQDIHLFPGYLSECKNWDCRLGNLKSPKLTLEGQNEVRFDIGTTAGSIRMIIHNDKVEITTSELLHGGGGTTYFFTLGGNYISKQSH